VAFNTLSAIVPASGRVAWQAVVRPSSLLMAGTGPAGVAVDTGDGLYLVDPRTGRQRWADTDGLELLGTSDVVTIEDDPDGGYRLMDRNAADGRARWSVPGAEFSQSAMAGGLVFIQNPAVPVLDAYRLGTGAPVWQVPFPAAGYSIQLAVVPGGVLLQALSYSCLVPLPPASETTARLRP
jgi:outer membrane protein assembly factor BamB